MAAKKTKKATTKKKKTTKKKAYTKPGVKRHGNLRLLTAAY